MSNPYDPNSSSHDRGRPYPSHGPQQGAGQYNGQWQGQGPGAQWNGAGQPYPGMYQPGQQQAPKKRNGCLIAVLAALGVIVLLIVLIAVVASGGDDDKAAVSGDGGNSGSSSQDEGSGGGPDFTGKTKNDTSAEAGQTITKKGIAITTTPLEAGGGDSSFSGPQLCTSVTVKNDGDKQQSFNPFDWKMQDPSGAARDTSFNSGDRPMLSSGEVAPGGSVTGDICFDGDPSANPGQYVLLYEGSIFSSDRLAWLNTL